MSERTKMVAGEPYDPQDAELAALRDRARALCQRINALPADQPQALRPLLAQLFGADTDARVTPPFWCDYGTQLRLGRGVYFNFGCVVLDVAPVTIGNHVLFGPGVHIYTAMHPMDAAQRRSGVERGEPVTVADDAWVGGGAIVCPGVRIGERAVVGAGSVVTRDIPADVFAAGNPCRVVRPLEPRRIP